MNILLLLILAAGVSRAADTLTPLDVKFGLWEITTVAERNGMPPIPAEALARMQPEQRARLEAQMKNMPSSQTATKQACLTKDDWAKSFAHNNGANKSCKETILTSTSTKQELKVDCDMSGNKSTDTVKIEALDSSHLKGLVLSTVGNNGRNMDVRVAITAKFISASCGDVKPHGKQE